MRIVVLDGYTLNPGDLSWSDLRSLGECVIHDRTAPGEVVERARDAEILLTNKTVLNAAQIHALPRLRYVGVIATGFNVVDIEAARARGVLVANVPAYGTDSVAQACFALLLELTHHAGRHSEGVHQGRWSRSPDFSYSEKPLVELAGLRFGIVGFGSIGQAVARIALAMGMRVCAHTRTPPGKPVTEVEFVDLDALFRTSDVVSLHCPLTPATTGMIQEARLASMKRTAFLINTSRGGLVKEPDLARALAEGWIAGAGLDVLTSEPPPVDHPLIGAPNCVITPHLAWATKAARSRLLNTVVDNVRAFLAGQPRNVVNA